MLYISQAVQVKTKNFCQNLLIRNMIRRLPRNKTGLYTINFFDLFKSLPYYDKNN